VVRQYLRKEGVNETRGANPIVPLWIKYNRMQHEKNFDNQKDAGRVYLDSADKKLFIASAANLPSSIARTTSD